MKTLTLGLALLTCATVTSVYAEGGADRLQARSDQWAQQRQQAKEALTDKALAQDKAASQQHKPAS